MNADEQLAKKPPTLHEEHLDKPPMLPVITTDIVIVISGGGSTMSDKDAMWQERRLEEILDSGADAASKAQQIIRLGFEPDVADELVERRQLGNSRAPMYYETLQPEDFYQPDDNLPSESPRR